MSEPNLVIIYIDRYLRNRIGSDGLRITVCDQ